MKVVTFPCWIETHRRMKWRLAVRIASLPDERWAKKEAEWNPDLSIKHKTCRSVGRPKKRWEDEINDHSKTEETEETKGNEIKNNDTWIKVAKNRERWKAMESEYAKTAAAVSVDSVHSRRYPPQDPVQPARYLNGVKLRWRTSRGHTPRTRLTLIDTGADIAYEIKHQGAEAQKG